MHADLGPEAQAIFRSIFLQDTASQLATAKAALAQPDYALLRRTAHSLAGAAANMGHFRLETFARRLECEAGLMTMEASNGLLDAISTELFLTTTEPSSTPLTPHANRPPCLSNDRSSSS